MKKYLLFLVYPSLKKLQNDTHIIWHGGIYSYSIQMFFNKLKNINWMWTEQNQSRPIAEADIGGGGYGQKYH